jgi:hypothetical protein
MSRNIPSWRNSIATFFVAGLFVLIGAGHDLLLAAHAFDSHARVACHESHHHGDGQPDEHHDEAPESQDADHCGICHTLIHAQSMKGGCGVEAPTLLIDQRIELAVIAAFDFTSVEIRESRARDPPARSL